MASRFLALANWTHWYLDASSILRQEQKLQRVIAISLYWAFLATSIMHNAPYANSVVWLLAISNKLRVEHISQTHYLSNLAFDIGDSAD